MAEWSSGGNNWILLRRRLVISALEGGAESCEMGPQNPTQWLILNIALSKGTGDDWWMVWRNIAGAR